MSMAMIPCAAAVSLLLCAAVSDMARFLIPNWVSAGLLALLPLAWLCGFPLHPRSAAAAFLLTVAATGALWHWRLWGGGDFKLMSALAPWVGLDHLWDFVQATALLGGAVALAIVFARRLARRADPDSSWLPPAVRRAGMLRHMPYGVAIAAAGAFELVKCLTANP